MTDALPTLRVAAVQMNSGADKSVNIATALGLIDQAAAGGARLVTLPEVWPYLGPSAGERDAAEGFPGPTHELLAARARKHGIYLHAGSMLESRPGEPRLFNTAVVFDPQGDVIARYSKIHIFDVTLDGIGGYKESENVAPGDEIVTVEIDGVQVGLAICYDLRFPELFRILALRGADAIILPAAFTMTTGKDHWETLIRARAIENGVYMVAPAQVGSYFDGKNDRWSYGRSLIVDPWGTVLATAPDAPTVITGTIDVARVRNVRRQVPSLANRMPDRYRWPDAVEAGTVVGR